MSLAEKLLEAVPEGWVDWCDNNLFGILVQLECHKRAERVIGSSWRAFLCWDRERAAGMTAWAFSMMLSELKYAWENFLRVDVIYEGDIPASIVFTLP